MRRLIGATLAVLTFAGAVNAEGPGPVVVELFTSQGCSSCPPADALLADLAQRDDVLPLSLHVDYWDYIGWPDTFASPAFTRRQKAYARSAGRSMIYTPQMIVGGTQDVVGHKTMKVLQAVEAYLAQDATVRIDVARREGKTVTVGLVALRTPRRGLVVQLVRFIPAAEVAIGRGENAGRSLRYTNVVTSLERLADWTGDAPLELDVAVPGEEAAAVLVQEDGYRRVLAAARLR